MPIDLSRNIDRFEADDLRQFNYNDTNSIPSSVGFKIYNTDGNALGPYTVVESGPGQYFAFAQLPSSRGYYTYEWSLFGSGTVQSSYYSITRGIFEIAKTEPVQFTCYGDKGNVMRVARQLIGRGDLTEHDIAPHMEAAYSYINGRLSGVSPVPLSPCPAYIKQGEEVIALYTLYATFGMTEKGEIPPSLEKLRDDFVLFLDNVVLGKTQLEGVPGIAGTVVYFNGGIEGGKPTFGRSPFENQMVDPNILSKESDDRSGSGGGGDGTVF